ncbi:Oidioi.mRNA.OKI2018_I69.XSR.g16373.t1.cds [Oikopleura dioica]|uniref:Oidioi.mRNA.OKI2018_I69.XSR.g16373.t1.cds n=1 Tax=Oikopleura dioica TaxID=34765 RepID=A0ABN7SFV7_OIKDI|nr:Oidioi.mRNA.OKI2018_I69.XSR.g16373.t1.cds [Oikopleura dioica]
MLVFICFVSFFLIESSSATRKRELVVDLKKTRPYLFSQLSRWMRKIFHSRTNRGGDKASAKLAVNPLPNQHHFGPFLSVDGNDKLPRRRSSSRDYQDSFDLSALKVSKKAKAKVQKWLQKQLSCEVEYHWVDLGPLSYPRYLAAGKCSQNSAASCGILSSVSSTCRPAKTRTVNVLRLISARRWVEMQLRVLDSCHSDDTVPLVQPCTLTGIVTQQPASFLQASVHKNDFKHGLFSCVDSLPACGICICAIVNPAWSVYTTQNYLHPGEAKCHALCHPCSQFVGGALCCAGTIEMAWGGIKTAIETGTFKPPAELVATGIGIKLAGLFFLMLPTWMVWRQRGEIKKKFNIPKDQFCDFLASFFCQICVMTQNERQVTSAAAERL